MKSEQLARWVLIVMVCAVLPWAKSEAQTLELGASIGTGNSGSEGSAIQGDPRVVMALSAGVLWRDRLETTFRVASLRLGPRGYTNSYFTGCGVGSAAACAPAVSQYVSTEFTGPRTYLTGMLLWHFRPQARVRPFSGVGLGTAREPLRATCEPVLRSCDELARLRLGSFVQSQTDYLLSAGVVGSITRRLVLRGAVNFHRPGGEELSLFETSVAVGYRFGRTHRTGP